MKREYLNLRKALELFNEVVFTTDIKGVINYVNPEFSRLYGYEAHEVVGISTPGILKGDDLNISKYKKLWETIIIGDIYQDEFINKNKDGKQIRVSIAISSILDEKEEIYGFICIQHDMTRQKLIEDALKISEEKFRKAFMTIPDAVHISKMADGMLVSVNSGFTKLFGFSESEAVGMLSLNIWTDTESRQMFINLVEKDEIVENFEATYKTKDGKIIYGLTSSSIIVIGGEKHLLSVTKDITQRKKVEGALRKEQFLMNALMNNLPDHIYFKDLESHFIRNSKSHALSFGFDDPDVLIGKTDFDFFTNYAASQAFKDEQHVIKTGLPIFKEEKLTRKDNTVAWFSARKLPLLDNEGRIIGTFGISRDITQRKKAEEALFHSEERYRAVTESANDAIISFDRNGLILGWNKGAEDIFGYSMSEVMGMSFLKIIPHDQLKIAAPDITQTGESWTSDLNILKSCEINGLKKNGSFLPLEISLAKWQTSEGNFFTGILRDITLRKRTELENKVNYEIAQGITTTSNLSELFKLIHESLSKCIYAENIFIALFNKKSGLFNFPYYVDKIDPVPEPASLEKSCTAYVFRTIKPFLYSEELFNKLVSENEVELVGFPSPSWIGIPLQTPSDVIGVLVLQHYEKENIYTEQDLRFLTSVGNQIAVSIERKRIEEEIKLKNELLQTINSEKDKFFSIVAHDLRGPLGAFVQATQMLIEEIETMSLEEIKEMSVIMKNSASNLYNLLENLLEWSRLQRGGIDFIPVKINTREKIEQCIDVLSEAAHKKNIEIISSFTSDIYANVDNHMFDSIIRNLLSNSIKFSKLSGSIHVTQNFNQSNDLKISISDTGIGMTEELKNKLFKLNEKVNRLGTSGEASTGLGLLLCKEFVEKHGGVIYVESEEGIGSTFSFTIPFNRVYV
jgi:PAS domain S-box-containing protein